MAEKKKDFKTTREGLVKIKHAGVDQLGTCLPEALETWEASGWTAVDPDSNDPVSTDELDKVNTSGALINPETETKK
jgi:hypothetical protein